MNTINSAKSRVMVRVPQLGRDTLLIPAEVISQSGDTLRVILKDTHRITEVLASETVPLAQAYGRPDATGQQAQPIRAFPTSGNALANRF